MPQPLIRSPNPLPDSVSISRASLLVDDVGVSRSFYADVLGLEVVRTDRDSVWLGAGGVPFLELAEALHPRGPAGGPGLFHLALLYPNRASLAAVVARIAKSHVPIQGSADHGVSEAVYLADPGGNGLEVYRDRARHEWPTLGNHLAMRTLPLDLTGLLGEARGSDGEGAPSDTRIGHIHLSVVSLPAAEAFYLNVLGLDLMQRYGDSASFLSAGGYHHHLAVNTWASHGAPPAPAGSAGLAWFQMDVPQGARRGLEGRLDLLDIRRAPRGAHVVLQDPSGIEVVV